MARNGRPPKQGVQREPNGRAARTQRDEGTPELRMQRIREHGMPDVGTTSPIDVLASKGLLALPNEGRNDTDAIRQINEARRQQANRFTAFYCRVFGSPHPRAHDFSAEDWLGDDARRPSLLTDEERHVLAWLTYQRMANTLSRIGRGALYAILDHVVMLHPLPPNELHRYEALSALRYGLKALEQVPPVKWSEVTEHIEAVRKRGQPAVPVMVSTSRPWRPRC